MKLTTINILPNDDGNSSCFVLLKTDTTEISLDFQEGEPEDNNLSRNFSDIYLISKLIRMAYDAGKRGEECLYFVEEYDTKKELDIIKDLQEKNISVNKIEYNNYIITIDNVETKIDFDELFEILNNTYNNE